MTEIKATAAVGDTVSPYLPEISIDYVMHPRFQDLLDGLSGSASTPSLRVPQKKEPGFAYSTRRWKESSYKDLKVLMSEIEFALSS
jgi:hypothetical protein